MDAKSLNRMLELRVKDLAERSPDWPREERLRALRKSLGLEPLPPRTDIYSVMHGTIQRDGYRIEKISFESRPGVLVTTHLYLPEGDGPFPLILRPHGHWSGKKSDPCVQASAISLCLKGFAVFVVDSPGHSWDVNPQNERFGLGSHDDPFLAMGAPVQGVYVWDLMRALDYCEDRSDLNTERVGITGESGGATVIMYAFALDTRIRAAAPVCGMSSLEINPHNGCWCNHVPGILALGDRADILGLRSDDGSLFVLGAEDDPEFPSEGHARTHEKLRRLYRNQRAEHRYRYELFATGHDYNRRMREAVLAFFLEQLQGESWRPYVPESRPLTDGSLNPYPSNTVPFDAPEMSVTTLNDRRTISFRDLLDSALAERYPEPIAVDRRLVPWGRFGRIEQFQPGAILALHDASIDSPKEPNSMPIPDKGIDLRLCVYLGLSLPEVIAQLLHLGLPGAPEGWEHRSFSADAITSMIASVKTLVSPPGGEVGPKLACAEGPIASMVALFLRAFRPELEVHVSHPYHSWDDLLQTGIPELIQPQARYLEWVGSSR